MNRRDVLVNGAGLVAWTALSKAMPALATRQEGAALPPLKTAAARSGRQVGIAADKALLQNAALVEIVVRDFNLLTISGLKWNAVHPDPDSCDFSEADWNLRFAEQHRVRVHGHNLCWNSPANYPLGSKPYSTVPMLKSF